MEFPRPAEAIYDFLSGEGGKLECSLGDPCHSSPVPHRQTPPGAHIVPHLLLMNDWAPEMWLLFLGGRELSPGPLSVRKRGQQAGCPRPSGSVPDCPGCSFDAGGDAGRFSDSPGL